MAKEKIEEICKEAKITIEYRDGKCREYIC